MQIDQLNLPTGVIIFQEREPKEKLSDEEIYTLISSSQIKNEIQEKTLLVINDAHRSTPSVAILEALSKMSHKITDLIIATGTHKPPSKAERSKLLQEFDKKLALQVHIHDCDDKNLIFCGTTIRGTEIWVNPLLFNFSHVLVINSVEPHYFAGWTGGVKSIIPGLAGRKTTEKNHSWALHASSGPSLIKNNPVQEDLWEGFELLEKKGIRVSAIQLVNNGEKIYNICTGSLRNAFQQAVSIAKEIYVYEVEERFDVVVAFVTSPLNRSLYQAQKGIENSRQVLREGGKMILVSECYEGIGNSSFFDTLRSHLSPKSVIDTIRIDTYKFGDHKAAKFASIALSNELFVVSEGLSLTQSKQVFARNISLLDLEDILLRETIEGKKIAIVLNAAMLALMLK